MLAHIYADYINNFRVCARWAPLCRVADDPGVLQHLRQRQALARHLGQQLRATQGRLCVSLGLDFKEHDSSSIQCCLATLKGTASQALPPQKLTARFAEAALAE